MTFSIHVIASKEISSIDEAIHITSRPNATHFDSQSQFRGFFNEVKEYFPDLSNEDEDGDNDNNIWPEGLPEVRENLAFVIVAIKTELVNSDVLFSLAAIARQKELQLLDPQNGHFYRLDSTRIDSRGEIRNLPSTPVVAKQINWSPATTVLAAPVLKKFEAMLSSVFKPTGFRSESSDDVCNFTRDISDLKQAARLSVGQSAPNCVYLNFSYGFTAQELRRHWMQVLKARGVDIANPWLHRTYAEDFAFELVDEIPPFKIEPFRLDHYLGSASAVDEYCRALKNWVDMLNDRLFASVTDLQSLGQFALGDWWVVKEKAMAQRYYIGTAFSQLILAALTTPKNIESIIELARIRYNPNQWRMYMGGDGAPHYEAVIDYARELANKQNHL